MQTGRAIGKRSPTSPFSVLGVGGQDRRQPVLPTQGSPGGESLGFPLRLPIEWGSLSQYQVL